MEANLEKGTASKRERRRTKVIPRLTDEKATLKLVFATVIRTAERWCRVSISDMERHHLELLSTGLGLHAPLPPKPQAPDARAPEHDQQVTLLHDA